MKAGVQAAAQHTEKPARDLHWIGAGPQWRGNQGDER
jgi:hypothetical protein